MGREVKSIKYDIFKINISFFKTGVFYMPRQERKLNQAFIDYMEAIVAHKNYKGLPIERKSDGSLLWVTTSDSKIGKARKTWAEEKAKAMSLKIQPGVYADVCRKIHPTKEHVCKICGSKMSIYYLYPSATFVKSLKARFGVDFSECDHICDIWDNLLKSRVPEADIINFMRQKFKLNPQVEYSKKSIIEACEHECRKNGKKYLGPGVMSNFPDRYDGFHTYNRCCRSSQDKGRSKDNMKSYTKDRRAFEYWSDGNIHAANMFMGSSFFKNTSADHIGAISLGFIHDPRYLEPMTSSANSTKRDRLLYEDIIKILAVEKRTKTYPMSWYSKTLWEYIKSNFENNKDKIDSVYRDMLKQNMADYMFLLNAIINKCGDDGKKFLFEQFIEPKYKCFSYDYEFDEHGNIIKQTFRNFTERSKNEMARFSRISFESVQDYNEKGNRHILQDLTEKEQAKLAEICESIKAGEKNYPVAFKNLQSLIEEIQQRIIRG
jgi:Alw26I/Eco31I/Esp3I family type II restriction endonuclease